MKFCYQLIVTLTEFVIYKGLYKKLQDFFASSEKMLFMCVPEGCKLSNNCYLGMIRLKSGHLIANQI